ncbi:MAG: XRE family transcriptional regulator [Campylobacterota bacterium]|nr:XRE family transcriptional regulator [Campylobacterota bacterium]
MELDDFKSVLKSVGFNKKSFAEYINVPYATVNNWGSLNRPPVPDWVEVLLSLYYENKKYKELKEIIKVKGLCD